MRIVDKFYKARSRPYRSRFSQINCTKYYLSNSKAIAEIKHKTHLTALPYVAGKTGPAFRPASPASLLPGRAPRRYVEQLDRFALARCALEVRPLRFIFNVSTAQATCSSLRDFVQITLNSAIFHGKFYDSKRTRTYVRSPKKCPLGASPGEI